MPPLHGDKIFRQHPSVIFIKCTRFQSLTFLPFNTTAGWISGSEAYKHYINLHFGVLYRLENSSTTCRLVPSIADVFFVLSAQVSFPHLFFIITFQGGGGLVSPCWNPRYDGFHWIIVPAVYPEGNKKVCPNPKCQGVAFSWLTEVSIPHIYYGRKVLQRKEGPSTTAAAAYCNEATETWVFREIVPRRHSWHRFRVTKNSLPTSVTQKNKKPEVLWASFHKIYHQPNL